MATTTKIRVVARRSRYNELKTMLENRRRQLVHEVQTRIRDARTDGAFDRGVLDEGESSEVDVQDEIGFALIQMKTETLNKIDGALRRLEEGTYGDCFECGEKIAEPRLWALPFAVRCKECEAANEQRAHRAPSRFLSALP